MQIMKPLLCALFACACASSPPQQVAVPAGSTAQDSAHATITRFLRHDSLPGYSVTVSIGRVNPQIWHEGFGYADVAKQIPATPHTKFRIGSDSKLLTSIMLMRMVQDGVLDLDKPISTYIKDLPPAIQPITLRQLAGHQGGIRHYRGPDFISTTHYSNLHDALSIFINDSLVAAPGTKYSYSSYGFNLIGAVMEARTGQPFAVLMKKYVLDPLDMDETVPDAAGSPISNRASLYSIDKTGVANAPLDDLSSRWPSGGYLSTSDDLATLGRSILAPGLLNRHSLETMLTPQHLQTGAATFVGIGWRISVDSAGRTYYHHGGSSNGGEAFVLVYPKEQVVVAFAANASKGNTEPEARAIAAWFLR